MCNTYAVVDVWRLEDISLDALKIVKKAPMHTVYKAEDCYLKVWKPDTRPFKNGRDQIFFDAVMEGVLDGIAPVRAVIVDGYGQCYGYATRICKALPFNLNEVKKYGLKVKKENLLCVARLFARMRAITLNKGYCFNDLAPSNLGIIDGKCRYFDLDGFWNFDQYKKRFSNWKQSLFYLADKFDEGLANK